MGGLFFCAEKPLDEDTPNVYILNVAAIIKNMVASAAESEEELAFKGPKWCANQNHPHRIETKATCDTIADR
jgi:hypothetical protein